MALLAIGINHRTAPVSVREQVAFAPEKLELAMNEACRSAGLREVVILSTCNRTELYGVSATGDAARVIDWLGSYHGLDHRQLQDCSYAYEADAAVRHLMRVACGLDSLVLGEPQILGQLKTAFAAAQQAGTVHAELGRLFQQTFAVAKSIRTETAIGQNPVSVAYAAVSLARHIFADLSRSRALLIGAGETIELVARHLRQANVREIMVANRTRERAQRLADEVGARTLLLPEIPEALKTADMVISSTASPLPILGKGAVERALRQRRHQPIFMVDIAVPRDIEPEVGSLADVYLYTVDDLQEVIEENVKSRQTAAAQAEALIARRAEAFMEELRSLDAVSTLRALRSRVQEMQVVELERARRQLKGGKDADQVLEQLARGLTNKLLHRPTIQLKQAGAQGRTDLMELTEELFDLTPADREQGEQS